MYYDKENKKVLIEKEVKNSFEDCKTRDYVSYRGKVYEFLGWSYGTYPNIRDLETNEEIEIYPYF